MVEPACSGECAWIGTAALAWRQEKGLHEAGRRTCARFAVRQGAQAGGDCARRVHAGSMRCTNMPFLPAHRRQLQRHRPSGAAVPSGRYSMRERNTKAAKFGRLNKASSVLPDQQASLAMRRLSMCARSHCTASCGLPCRSRVLEGGAGYCFIDLRRQPYIGLGTLHA